MRKSWPLLLMCLAMGLVACSGEESAMVDTPPVGGEEPGPPAPPVPPGPGPGPGPAPPADPGPWVLNLARGQALFAEKCQHCHGPGGVGGYGPALTNTVTCPPCAEFTQLWRRIDEYMPFRNPEACDAPCSRDIAAWISNDFSTTPSCSVDFRFDSVAGQQFTATVRIANFRGLDVPRWRLGFTLPPNHAVTTSINALAVQTGNQLLVVPGVATPGIADDAVLEIGLEGTHDGIAIAPADLRLEAAPCFTAPPAAAS